MGEKFIVDTNVLIHDPCSPFKFDSNTLVIPVTVVEEPDKFKQDLNMVGRNARVALRIIDSASNGLLHMVEKFRDEPLAGNITLKKGVRSARAELASNIL